MARADMTIRVQLTGEGLEAVRQARHAIDAMANELKRIAESDCDAETLRAMATAALLRWRMGEVDREGEW